MTISKDNNKKKIDSLIAQIKRWKDCFHRGFRTFQSFIKFKNKNMTIIKVQKSKTWGPSKWSLSPPFFLASLHISFFILQSPLHVILQPLLVPRSGIDVSRRNNAFRHPMAWPSLTNPTQDPIGKHCWVEGTFIMRSSLTLFELPWDTISGVVWAATKSN